LRFKIRSSAATSFGDVPAPLNNKIGGAPVSRAASGDATKTSTAAMSSLSEAFIGYPALQVVLKIVRPVNAAPFSATLGATKKSALTPFP
jgi:hypothetical protein